MMTCRGFLEQLDDLAAKTLPPEAQRLADDHLLACPPCLVILQTYQVTIRLTRQLSGPCDPPAHNVDGLQ
jgi:hypothetical protein